MSAEFELQPFLEGELVRLRPLRESDYDSLYAVASDPLIWEQHPQNDRWRDEVFRDFFQGAIESGGALLALDSASGAVIGSSRYSGWDPERREVEIGWTFLARSHWGGAANGEMKRLMLGHAFRFAERVLFIVGAENLRSQRAVQKIGGRPIGRRERFGRENLVFAIDAMDWRADEKAEA